MKRLSMVLLFLATAAALALASGAQEGAAAGGKTDTIRFVWFTDGPDKPAIEGLVARFSTENPDTKVDFSIVPYAELNQMLTTQASAGQAPDLARVSEPYRFFQYTLDMRPHLKNKSYAAEFLAEPMKMVTGAKGEVYGIPHDLTMNGPFINVSLVKKAGLALPTKERVTWQEWMDLAVKVKKATGVPFAAAMDRSGHRLDGFVQSFGGSYFTSDGKGLRITSPETREAIDYFVGLNTDGVMALDFWAGGSGYVGANQQFVNGQLVFYISGNWQVGQFHETIGNKFEWQAVPNGYNTQAGGMPGGKYLIAFKDTRAPAKVTRLIEFLGSAGGMAEYATKALTLPARKDLIEKGLTYPVENATMNAFIKGLGLLPASAYTDNYHLRFGPVANEVRDRVSQAVTGELSVDEALKRAEAKSKELLQQ